MLQKKNLYRKIPQQLRDKNLSQAFLCLQRIKGNLCWKIKVLKQATYIRYVLAKLSKFVQSSTQTTLNSFLKRIRWKIKGVWN